MNELTIIKKDGGAYIDSREVAAIIGKRHDHLLRDIGKYREIIAHGGLPKIGESDFFVESTYQNAQNKEMPCYLLTKMGCETVAHKLTGEKGVLFTAVYVSRFNELEAIERAELVAKGGMPAPRLGEYNACARIIVRAMQCYGATPERIIVFLKGIYEPLGICVTDDNDSETMQRMYTAKEIAETLGIYSLTGNPHSQAVSCIINENLCISDEHINVTTFKYGNRVGVSVRYDEYAAKSVNDWIIEYGYPDEVYGFARTFKIRHIRYPGLSY